MLTVEHASQHFKLSSATLRKKAANGEINCIRIGREYRFEWADIWACEKGRTPRSVDKSRYQLDLLGKGEIAAALSVSVRTVERWIADGMPTRNAFGSVRCNPLDITEWLRGRGVPIGNEWWCE